MPFLFMKISEKIRAKKEDLIPFILVLGIIITFFLGLATKKHIALDLILVLELVFFASLLFLSGLVVFRSLFKITAGFSFLNLLAQSYCNLPLHTTQNDRGLVFILTFGLGYLIYDFFRSLYKDFLERKHKLNESKRQLWKKISVAVIYIMLIVLFVYNLYKVVNPIVLNYCVFK